jgi:uncharacterized repeat protein (TIGR03803 family)
MKPKLSLFSFRQCLVTTVLGLLVAESAWAGTSYTVLHNFNGTDGEGPWGGVVVDHAGNVYGTGGGGMGDCRGGCGVVFGLAQTNGEWAYSVLYDFVSCDSGCYPQGTPLIAAAGVYGTTVGGPHYPGGAVFELTQGFTGWSETLLHAFCPTQECKDGAVPFAGVITDGSGNLYGTTAGGGPHGGGVVFRLAPGRGGWKETVIHGFHPSYYNQPAPGGTGPYAGLIVDSVGNLYGTTANGGALCNGWSCGVVYELKPLPGGGWKEVVLHRFHNNGTDGSTPGWGALYMDAAGILYGTTQSGGSYAGVIYKLKRDSDGQWKETILYDFKSGVTGNGPNAGVAMDGSGNLYGTTDYGGYGDCGVIYKLAHKPTGKWAYTVLHTFGHGDDGCLPEGNLVIDQKGRLYGGTVLGGAYGAGVVFELTP